MTKGLLLKGLIFRNSIKEMIAYKNELYIYNSLTKIRSKIRNNSLRNHKLHYSTSNAMQFIEHFKFVPIAKKMQPNHVLNKHHNHTNTSTALAETIEKHPPLAQCTI